MKIFVFGEVCEIKEKVCFCFLKLKTYLQASIHFTQSQLSQRTRDSRRHYDLLESTFMISNEPTCHPVSRPMIIDAFHTCHPELVSGSMVNDAILKQVQDDKLAVHANSISRHNDKLAVHVNSTSRHNDKLAVHVNSTSRHNDKLAVHVNSISRHNDKLAVHVNSTSRHNDKLAVHVNSTSLHNDKLAVHVNSALQQDDKLKAQPSQQTDSCDNKITSKLLQKNNKQNDKESRCKIL